MLGEAGIIKHHAASYGKLLREHLQITAEALAKMTVDTSRTRLSLFTEGDAAELAKRLSVKDGYKFAFGPTDIKDCMIKAGCPANRVDDEAHILSGAGVTVTTAEQFAHWLNSPWQFPSPLGAFRGFDAACNDRDLVKSRCREGGFGPTELALCLTEAGVSPERRERYVATWQSMGILTAQHLAQQVADHPDNKFDLELWPNDMVVSDADRVRQYIKGGALGPTALAQVMKDAGLCDDSAKAFIDALKHQHLDTAEKLAKHLFVLAGDLPEVLNEVGNPTTEDLLFRYFDKQNAAISDFQQVRW
jgi:hypothetical protein